MTTANFSVVPGAAESANRRHDLRPRQPAAETAPTFPAAPITIATLLDEARSDEGLRALQKFARSIGAPIDWQPIATHLARTGVVGRISVPKDAGDVMLRQGMVVGATIDADPLAPVSRLWRGLQRRADVLVDMRRCRTLPGSAAAEAGVERDVLLFSQRVVERTTLPRRAAKSDVDSAGQWSRARSAAELAYRHASAENRQLLLVLPVGRGTDAQRLFGDALERQARLQRLAPPRRVKAGLLSALLMGESDRSPWLAASVMSIEELSATAAEAIGDTGPWPVVSLGQHATFYNMPQQASGAADPVPMLLVLASLLHRDGRVELARQLMASVCLTSAALARMRDELGTAFSVPTDAFLSGVLTNWGRTPAGEARVVARVVPTVQGLRLRIATPLGTAAVRDAVSAALMPTGLEVASVRSLDALDECASSTVEVRVRTRLGEPMLPDDASGALARTLSPAMRCVAIEPWVPGSGGDRSRQRMLN